MKNKYKTLFSDKKFIVSLCLGFGLLIGSMFVNYYAAQFALEEASSPVTDIVLNNTRAFDLDLIFLFGPIIIWLLVVTLCVIEPKRMPFVTKSVALFIIIRSFFVTLTHIGPFPDQVKLAFSSDVIKAFTSGADLFFSGHTGLPFLIALIFWENKFLRSFFIGVSILFGCVVLLAHLHYSIDVLSAFFITHTIYVMAKKLFPRDEKLFSETKLI